MDFTTVAQLIGSLGFPIVCVIILFWYIYKRDEADKEEREMHKVEVAELKDAIANNTLVMQKLLDKMGGGDIDA